MARDYKNTGSHRRPSHPAVSGWLWMTTGLTIGLLVALLVYLSGQEPPAGTKLVLPGGGSQATATKDEEQKGRPRSDLRFEFYTLLPESEVVIPDDELAQRTPEGKPRPIPPGTYMLQAGSFRQAREAEALKGELALLGIVANIQDVTINGDTWHRVRLGPFDTLEEINRVRRQLREHEINAIPIRVKG
ncbi:MAG: SPOR domain-containing protein [Gammaproteobacteria bacterium]|nr:SPOR domain-containing protein [Gammaproteobacteria bacterium]NIR98222.1 SPOR domain-containing protein [Gammaproteobacteria bacterium]NIT63893.1 SPOR domain-containing protein [Gammaproteobacteria bacterium]NIV20897.1 SPOR domain-containing protein [Gammaproteobacteria bacterium]NIY32473.1 SPOR domain-containing protein [Gammaproteobacteria bacterium]